MDRPGEGQMMVRWSGDRQVRVKSQKYSELDIGGRETCYYYLHNLPDSPGMLESSSSVSSLVSSSKQGRWKCWSHVLQ